MMSKKKAFSLVELIDSLNKEEEKVSHNKDNPADCPFCGSYDSSILEETQVYHNEYVECYVVVCNVCDCRAPMADTEEYAWKLWNERKNHSPLCPQEH
jgi:Lar family restriction alleviation protein